MKVAAIVVTYNRLIKLKKCLNSFENQTKKPDLLIIVNNASTDGTDLFLDEWRKTTSMSNTVLTAKENEGGSGGFAIGIEYAVQNGFDWFYLGDDDAYPNNDCFQEFSSCLSKISGDVGAICGVVKDAKGISLMHRRTIKKGIFVFKECNSKKEDYDMASFNVDLFSFVGSFVKADIVSKIGLPIKDYFIWYDDSEYSYRITRLCKALCFNSIEVFHDCSEANQVFSWKNFYGYRNKMDMLKRDVGVRYYRFFKLMLNISSVADFFVNHPKYQAKKDAIKCAKKGILGKNSAYLP